MSTTQSTLIQRIKQLCVEHKFDEAVKLTNEIEIPRIAAKAHLLCIEYEQACINNGTYKPGIL